MKVGYLCYFSAVTNILKKEIRQLVIKEFRTEWRQKASIGGIFIYVISTVFVCYLSFKKVIDIPTWNALFWIIMLFASINAIAKSFIQESKGRLLYLYTIISPEGLILAKMIYNTVLMLILSILCLGCYVLLVGELIQNLPLFIITLLLGSSCFAGTFTLMSAIASQASNNSSLMAILSFPVILPLLITLIQLSKNALDGLPLSVSYNYLIVLLLLNGIVTVLSWILFSYLWRD